MSKAILSQLPPQVAEVLNLMAERYGYFLGRREKLAEKRKATKDLEAQARELRAQIESYLNAYIEKGEDVRESVMVLRKRLAPIEGELAKIRAPFNEVIRPLNRAIRHLDSLIIPRLEKIRGEKITPKFTVDIEIPKKKPKKKAT